MCLLHQLVFQKYTKLNQSAKSNFEVNVAECVKRSINLVSECIYCEWGMLTHAEVIFFFSRETTNCSIDQWESSIQKSWRLLLLLLSLLCLNLIVILTHSCSIVVCMSQGALKGKRLDGVPYEDFSKQAWFFFFFVSVIFPASSTVSEHLSGTRPFLQLFHEHVNQPTGKKQP